MTHPRIDNLVQTITELNQVDTTSASINVVCPECMGNTVVVKASYRPTPNEVHEEEPCRNCKSGLIKINVTISRDKKEV